jgi:ABC-2 type transport system permease protein
MKRILAQCQKELAQFRRDRLTLALAFLLPFITLLIFGYTIRLESKDIPVVVQDFDQTRLSRSYTERLYGTNQFIPCDWSGTDPARDAIDQGIAKAAIIIPPEFSRQVNSGTPVTLQVLVDAADVNNARVIRAGIQSFTNFFLQEEGLISTESTITAKIRLWFNPGRLESLYIVPGTFGVVLWIFPSLLSAIAMVRERDKGTILQVYTSGISGTELLLGKGLAYWLIALSEALIMFALSYLFFGLRFATIPIPLAIGTTLFLADSILFGLMLGVKTGSQAEAVQAVSLVGFITSLLLSGFIYPLTNIPFPLSLIPNIIPARYFIEITRDAFVRGTGFVGVWFNLLMLFVIGFLLLNAAREELDRMQLPD